VPATDRIDAPRPKLEFGGRLHDGARVEQEEYTNERFSRIGTGHMRNSRDIDRRKQRLSGTELERLSS
jgi:hypothetical protein